MDTSDDTFSTRYHKMSPIINNSSVKSTVKRIEEQPLKKMKEKAMDSITSRTGGAYIPPAKLRLMQKNITDKSSAEYQRISWEALKKSINGLINKVNVSNIAIIVRELFKENLIRGKGLLCRSTIQAQSASPTFTHVYAALVAILNTKFPKIGELVLKRLIIQFRKCYRRNDKQGCISSARFVAHLVNQEVAHEIVALELLTLLLENATNDSVEVAVSFLKECGRKLTDVSQRGILAIFERLRNILHEGLLDKRVQYMIEVMFAIRKDNFKDHPAIIPELDLIEESEQFTHLMTLEEPVDPEDMLNVFNFDANFQENEDKYKAIKKVILDDESTDDEDNEDDDSDMEDEDEDNEEDGNVTDATAIIDNTETNLTSLRRTIYLTIQSSLDFEECAHKLLKLELQPGQIVELCHMIVDCCAQQRTYMKFYGLLAERFCLLNAEYAQPFTDIFKSCYDSIHRFETNKLRNVAQLFAHLLFTDAIAWTVLSHIKLNEEDTTSSSRVFIKILFQELASYMGLSRLNDRIKDATLQQAFDGLFPRDNPQNTRFAINFFTSIGLGGLTDDLREHLKSTPKITQMNDTIVANTMNKQETKEEKMKPESSSSGQSSTASSPSRSSSSSSSSSYASSSYKKASRKTRKYHRSRSSHKKKIDKRRTDHKNTKRNKRKQHKRENRHK